MTSPHTVPPGLTAYEREVLIETFFGLMSDFSQGLAELDTHMTTMLEDIKKGLYEHRGCLPAEGKQALRKRMQKHRHRKDEVSEVGQNLMHYCGRDKCKVIQSLLRKRDADWTHMENLIEYGSYFQPELHGCVQPDLVNLKKYGTSRQSKIDEIIPFCKENECQSDMFSLDGEGDQEKILRWADHEQDIEPPPNISDRGSERVHNSGNQITRHVIHCINDASNVSTIDGIDGNDHGPVSNALSREHVKKITTKYHTKKQHNIPFNLFRVVQQRKRRVMFIAMILQILMVLFLFLTINLSAVCEGQSNTSVIFNSGVILEPTLYHTNGRPPT